MSFIYINNLSVIMGYLCLPFEFAELYFPIKSRETQNTPLQPLKTGSEGKDD